jgi:hypothetical protein
MGDTAAVAVPPSGEPVMGSGASAPGVPMLAVSVVRNEIARMPFFLEYHRRLGVGRFLVVDNASDDGTAEFLKRQDDVRLFHIDESYAEAQQGVTWLNRVLNQNAVGRWVLVVDADELFVFPMSEWASLADLAGYAEEQGADAIEAFLLDMYGEGQISETVLGGTASWFETCFLFDADTYRFPRNHPNYRLVPTAGGPRERLFWTGAERPTQSPLLGKVPFLKWRHGLAFESSTHIIDGLTPAPVTGALLHFKLVADMFARVEQEVTRKEHWRGAVEYSVYAEVLAANPGLSARCESSVRFTGTDQLVQLGLMQMPLGFPEAMRRRSAEGRQP